MVYVTQKRILALAIIVGMSFGLLTYQVSSYIVLSQVDGVPVSNTVFVNLPKDSKMPVFDMTGMVSKNGTYFIDSMLWDMPLIPSSEAIDIAFEFLRDNFNATQLETAHVWTCNLVGNQPTWSILIDGSIVTQIYVNAVTGEVVGWNLSELSVGAPGPYYENNSIISPAVAEKSAYDFLVHNNYSIPDTARYVGAKKSQSDPNYYIIFRHYEGQFPVGWVVTDPNNLPDQSSEGIILRVDERTAEVTQLGYRWTEVVPPPVIGVVPEWQARSAVMDYYASENVSIVYSRILLTPINSLKSSDGSDQIHLAWRIGVIREATLYWLFVDAYTGKVIDERETNGGGSGLVTTNTDAELSSPMVVVLAAISVGVLVAAFSRYLLYKRYLFFD